MATEMLIEEGWYKRRLYENILDDIHSIITLIWCLTASTAAFAPRSEIEYQRRQLATIVTIDRPISEYQTTLLPRRAGKYRHGNKP
jgi:hypothetical protein